MRNEDIHILVVDDEKDLAELTAEFLSMEDFQSAFKVSGPEALEYIDEKEVHVIISDAHMPGMTGMELFSKLQESNYQGLFYLYTGDGNEEEAEFMKQGIAGMFSKPFDLQEMVERILKDYAEKA